MERKELIQSYFSKLSNALLAIYREEFAERGGSDDEMHEMFKEMKKAPKRKKIVFERYLKELMGSNYLAGSNMATWVMGFFGKMWVNRPDIFGSDSSIIKPHIFADEMVKALNDLMPPFEAAAGRRSFSLADIKAQLKDRMEKSYKKGVRRTRMILAAVEGVEKQAGIDGMCDQKLSER